MFFVRDRLAKQIFDLGKYEQFITNIYDPYITRTVLTQQPNLTYLTPPSWIRVSG